MLCHHDEWFIGRENNTTGKGVKVNSATAANGVGVSEGGAGPGGYRRPQGL